MKSRQVDALVSSYGLGVAPERKNCWVNSNWDTTLEIFNSEIIYQ